MQGSATLLTEVQTFLEQLTTTRGRLAMSAVLVGFTVVLASLLVPYTVDRLRDVVNSRFLSGPVGESVEAVGDYFPTTFTELVVRVVQLTVILSMVLALLVVWGMDDVAFLLLVGALATIPDVARVAGTVAMIVLALIAFDQLRNVIAGFSKGADRVTEHQEEILLRVGQVTVFVTVTAMILGIWGVELSGLLVGAGFLGIVVGFAARQTLGSLIAGFVLMFSRPFTIGDWVEIGDSQGIVTDITIFNTRLENFDGEFVVIPNDRVSDRSVTNRSQKGLLRLRTDVGIDYEADVETAREIALETMEDVDEVETSPHPQVIPKGFGDSAILLELRYWIDHPSPPRKWKAVSAVVTGVKEAFDEEGITIPFPQRTVSGRDEASLDADGQRSLVDGGKGNGAAAESPVGDSDD